MKPRREETPAAACRVQEGVREREEGESGVERGCSRGEVRAQCCLLPLLSAHPPPPLVQSKQTAVGIKEERTGNMTQRDKMIDGQRKED